MLTPLFSFSFFFFFNIISIFDSFPLDIVWIERIAEKKSVKLASMKNSLQFVQKKLGRTWNSWWKRLAEMSRIHLLYIYIFFSTDSVLKKNVYHFPAQQQKVYSGSWAIVREILIGFHSAFIAWSVVEHTDTHPDEFWFPQEFIDSGRRAEIWNDRPCAIVFVLFFLSEACEINEEIFVFIIPRLVLRCKSSVCTQIGLQILENFTLNMD